jgi:hypothetical protein
LAVLEVCIEVRSSLSLLPFWSAELGLNLAILCFTCRLVLRVMLELRELDLVQDGRYVLPSMQYKSEQGDHVKQIDARAEQLASHDPIHTFDLKQCLQQALYSASEGRGGLEAVWNATNDAISPNVRQLLEETIGRSPISQQQEQPIM